MEVQNLPVTMHNVSKGAERTKRNDERVHHDFPSVDRQIGIVETPIERFRRDGFIGRIVIRSQVLVSQRLGRIDSFPGIEDEHFFEKVERERIRSSELLREGNSLSLRERLHESKSLLVMSAGRLRKWERKNAHSRCKSSG